ncbi:putative major facilitator superfamily [Paratrimastix pyriformis]|uniref:Major facilitator superfamily n=1 Tax=Paratrimastix pyriformis TaxID=342808 RepID=A0ABQ8UFV2_9EUKA|nr:putative major facilitator superfamily [Paratrimastix pyriformis]
MESYFIWIVLGSFVALCGFLYYKKQRISSQKFFENAQTAGGDAQQYQQYLKFKWIYLVAYLLVVTGDWFQGPYLYAVYASFGFTSSQISAFYLCGFSSALIFGTIVGSLGDKYGRKRNSLACCLFYIGSSVFLCTGNFWMLLLGRVCGGIGTSLMYSAFEAWMVCAHKKAGYPDSWLQNTFGDASLGNGIVAIAAGVVASFLADQWGPQAPFYASALLHAACGVVIFLTWTENYGESKTPVVTTNESAASAAAASSGGFSGALALFRADPSIAALGLVMALFEGTMYTFVYCWTPALAPNHEPLPFGLIFAAYMAAVMVGGSTFSIVAASQWMTVERFALALFAAGAVSLTGSALLLGAGEIVFLCFCVFEGCVGSFWPTAGTIRSRIVPEQVRATVLNLFRVPLNAMVMGTMGLTFVLSTRSMLLLCGLFLAIATALQRYINVSQERKAAAAAAAVPVGAAPAAAAVPPV